MKCSATIFQAWWLLQSTWTFKCAVRWILDFWWKWLSYLWSGESLRAVINIQLDGELCKEKWRVEGTRLVEGGWKVGRGTRSRCSSGRRSYFAASAFQVLFPLNNTLHTIYRNTMHWDKGHYVHWTSRVVKGVLVYLSTLPLLYLPKTKVEFKTGIVGITGISKIE